MHRSGAGFYIPAKHRELARSKPQETALYWRDHIGAQAGIPEVWAAVSCVLESLEQKNTQHITVKAGLLPSVCESS